MKAQESDTILTGEIATPVDAPPRISHIACQWEGEPENLIALCGKKLDFIYTPRSGELAECATCELLASAMDFEDED